ncbi:hypothetical protein IFM89_019312 [Coptis chinensis]|uniref:Proteasome subunit alpha type n=1 Tax=Coptis chinensis TaxID=261450 RepID=A0A835IAN2_9MAGN|nr:hypothetical protein IFM89_019312 [Coptis chinensis]
MKIKLLSLESYVCIGAPDGRVFQMEYASKAVDNSGTVIGNKCKDGVVMGVEKLIASKMMLHGSNRRIPYVHRHSGMTVAGLAADMCICAHFIGG